MVELYDGGWYSVQAPTQFQGPGSSHELAVLSITEAISYGFHVNKDPVYLLLLDAQSAFDRVIIDHAIRCAYLAGTRDEGLLYINHRLRNRHTFVEWEKQILGPIRDTIGVEQGGCFSDRIYRLVNNEQLEMAQQSELGVDLGLVETDSGTISRQVLSAVGQADDVGLLTTTAQNLKILLHLSKLYCEKYQVKLVGPKTKLLVFTTKTNAHLANIELAAADIVVDGETIIPTTQASHVGVVRSVEGNSPNIIERLSAHRKAVFSVLHGGLARVHR